MLNLLRPLMLLSDICAASFYPCCCEPGGGVSGGSSLLGSSPPPGVSGSSGSSGSGGPAAEDEGPDRGGGSGGFSLCTGFIDAVAPKVIRVDLHGIQDLDCPDCNLLNGSYYCAYQLGVFPGRLCTWALVFDGLCDNEYDQMELVLRKDSVVPGRYYWSVTLDGKLVIASEALQIDGTLDAANGDRMAIAEIDGFVLTENPADPFNTQCRFGPSPNAVLFPVV